MTISKFKKKIVTVMSKNYNLDYHIHQGMIFKNTNHNNHKKSKIILIQIIQINKNYQVLVNNNKEYSMQ